jgi:NTE family protein
MTGRAPDALVLGGGGILGEAWMLAVLAGLEEASGFDPRTANAFVGTSAGSIVAAALAAGIPPRERLGGVPEPPPASDEAPEQARIAAIVEGVLGIGRGAVGLLAPAALRVSVPGGALLRRLALGRVPRGRRSLRGLGRALDDAGARWDGRLQVSAVDLGSGRRVMFGAPGAPQARVGTAVEASCAIPGVFTPIEIGGRSYVDGGAWSPTNMDVLPVERGTEVLALNPTGSLRGGMGSPVGAFGQVSRSIARFEALALERRGARVRLVAPDAASSEAMGSNLMDAGPRERVAAAGYAQGLALGRR